jgi:4-alpha-glucanotransferase
MSSSNGRRRAGLLIPLFSCSSTASWGIGDIADIEPLTAWLANAGQHILQLLPLNEMAPGQQSPYSAISAMAIDPIFISVPQVAEFAALGGEDGLPPADREALTAVRLARRIEYKDVRALKRRALRSAFEHFLAHEWHAAARSAVDRSRAARARQRSAVPAVPAMARGIAVA